MWWTILLLASLATTASAAEDCAIGIYGDAAATVEELEIRGGSQFDVYVVLETEAMVRRVAYSIQIPDLYIDIFIVDARFGTDGRGTPLDCRGSPGASCVEGLALDLRRCYPGFLGAPVVVARYSMVVPFYSTDRLLTLGPHPDDEDTLGTPAYGECRRRGSWRPCPETSGLLLHYPLFRKSSTEPSSFGRVKALFVEAAR